MRLPPSSFWHWFRGYAGRIPIDDIPDELQDELLSQLHAHDERLYFLISTNSSPRELIITADGNQDAFSSARSLVAAAPTYEGWKVTALKPATGFDFRYTDGVIQLEVSKLWFRPIKPKESPSALGIVIGFPDADFVLENQSVDTAYTILEMAIGESACAEDIAQVTVDDTPAEPEASGYIRLPQLADYIAFHKGHHSKA